MFKTDSARLPAGMVLTAKQAEKNYVIQKNDYLDVRLYSNRGEKLIDFYIQSVPGSNAGGGAQGSQPGQGPRFLVQDNGYVKLPMVGEVELAGLTLHQADSVLELAYVRFYEEPFVNTRFDNKRVIVLGAAGQAGQVIPLTNEHMNLIEVIALSGGVNTDGRVRNIRLIRGDLSNPEVYLIDLSTVEGMTKANLAVQSNDIIYIEPVRKIFSETLRDISPILGLVTSVISLIVLIRTFNQN